MVRSAPQERVSNHGAAPSFETPRHSASKTRVAALTAWLLRMRRKKVYGFAGHFPYFAQYLPNSASSLGLSSGMVVTRWVMLMKFL